MQNKQQHSYVLGLDVGIASIGWALVSIDKDENPVGLLDFGVRIFPEASNNAERRLARSQRRTIHRRALRMRKAKALLLQAGVLQQDDFLTERQIRDLPNNPWELRVKGLTEKLNAKEWSAVLLHLLKHRGYLSQRKSESQTTDKEKGKLLSGVKQNHELLQEKHYQTCAELALAEFGENLRNHQGSYSHTFDRNDLKLEMQLLFSQQRQFGNPFTAESFEAKFCDLLMHQYPALSGDALLKMVGKCAFENEYKAAKMTYSAERFVWLTKLNNLRLEEGGKERALSAEERALLLAEPYNKASLKYSQVRKALNLNDKTYFKGLFYDNGNSKKEQKELKEEEIVKKAENKVFMELKGYHSIRKALTGAGLKKEWQALSVSPEKLDGIGTVFSLYKTDKDIRENIAPLNLSDDVLEALLENINFSKFIGLSLTALRKILPAMESGQRYDEACKAVYGDHYGKKNQKLNDVRNPVVLRAVTQCRKVINAIIRQYGMPARVHIESGRELGKSAKERGKIENQQKVNAKNRNDAILKFKENFPNFLGEPKGKDILKMRLYEEQNEKCLYSGKTLDILRLNEKGYVEIDHVLPFSRTWDDSFNNKALVLAGENQNKGNKTPYEWFGHDAEKWENYVARVQISSASPIKKQRLITKSIDEKAFITRNLNDTRYISRFLTNWIKDHLALKGPVFTPNGRITALLRGYWGIKKSRDENDRHHAMDAIVIACSTPAMQQKITRYVKQKECKYIDYETGEIIRAKKPHFPQPWEFFTQEVNVRVFSDHPAEELAEKVPDRAEKWAEFVRPLFVSRMPKRSLSRQGHDATVRSPKYLAENKSTARKKLTELKLSDLEKMVDIERNRDLYQGLKARLEAFNNKPKQAFAEPFYKKGGQIVKSVKLFIDIKKNGVILHQGTGFAEKPKMVRVDLFVKKGEYFLVPVYAWQVVKGILPTKAIKGKKNEDEWEDMDEQAEFIYSIYPNDLIKVTTKEKTVLGYYISTHRGCGTIKLKVHDNAKTEYKDGEIDIGVRKALNIEKYEVDVLGHISKPCKKEVRQGFK